MRKLTLATTMIILHAFPAFADDVMQPIQLSDAQWASRPYAVQPMAQPVPVQRVAQPVAPAAAATPDIANSWDVMQYNFGM